jgi:hypothetical protein
VNHRVRKQLTIALRHDALVCADVENHARTGTDELPGNDKRIPAIESKAQTPPLPVADDERLQ